MLRRKLMCRCSNVIFRGCFTLRCFKQETSLSIFCQIPIAIFNVELILDIETRLRALVTDVLSKPLRKATYNHCVKSVRIWSFSGLYFPYLHQFIMFVKHHHHFLIAKFVTYDIYLLTCILSFKSIMLSMAYHKVLLSL